VLSLSTFFVVLLLLLPPSLPPPSLPYLSLLNLPQLLLAHGLDLLHLGDLREGGREGGRKGGREGGRKEGRGAWVGQKHIFCGK